MQSTEDICATSARETTISTFIEIAEIDDLQESLREMIDAYLIYYPVRFDEDKELMYAHYLAIREFLNDRRVMS